MKNEIELIQTNRFTVLYGVYKESKARIENAVNVLDLAAKSGIKNGNFKEVMHYLVSEKYLSTGYIPSHAHITHEGKVAVEFAVTNPDSRSGNFPPFNDMGI